MKTRIFLCPILFQTCKIQYISFISEILFTVENTEDTKRTDGEFVWKITSFRKLFMEHKSERDSGRVSKYSHLFQTPEGYEFRLRLFLNGAGRGKGTHVSVFLQLCRTDFDEILSFPFKGVFTVTLYDQNPKRKKEHFSVKFKSNDSNCFAKPTAPYNPENGIAKFVSHDHLEKHQKLVFSPYRTAMHRLICCEFFIASKTYHSQSCHFSQ